MTHLEPDEVAPITREPKSYPPETVLDFDQLLEWLQISKRQAERLRLQEKLPHVHFGPKTRRFIVSQVLRYFDQEAGL